MATFKYKHVFEPIQLAGTIFRNRIFAAPTGHLIASADSMELLGAAYYYGRKAMGGAASVCTGELAVDGEYGRGFTHRGTIYEVQKPLARVATTVARYGAVPTAELFHAGMYANRDIRERGVAFGPVTCEVDGRMVDEMSEEQIENTIAKYAEAAVTAKKCGFGMVLIHAGHGWLPQQFLSPLINTRKDKWGGPDIENRARLTVAICDAIHRAVGPNMPVEVRISGSERYDGGYGLEEGIAYAKQLDGHADLIHVSAGNHEIAEVFSVTHPRMFLPEGYNVCLAAEIKKHVKTPVATIGGLGDPEMLEEIVASGQADIVEMARSLIADPDLPIKMRTGKEDDITPCMRCLSCFSMEVAQSVAYCAFNPENGYLGDTLFYDAKVNNKKRVLVAGGGIGGMQAALSCAGYGHTVTLFEESGELGGAIKCEKNVPFKKKLDVYIETQKRRLARAEVEILMNTTLTPELAEELKPDAIIAATGSRPIKPDIPGIDGDNVLEAQDAYIDPGKTGSSVVIIGAGLVGLELGVYLAMNGRSVVVVEMADKANDGGNFLHMQGLKVELKSRGIEVFTETSAKEIKPDGLLCQTQAGEKFFPAETVVYAVGQEPRREDAIALNFSAPEFYMLGDCVMPSNITAATGSAYDIARNIGRI